MLAFSAFILTAFGLEDLATYPAAHRAGPGGIAINKAVVTVKADKECAFNSSKHLRITTAWYDIQGE